VSLNLTAHTLFNPNFGGVPVAPDRPCWASARAEALAIRPWNYFLRIPTYVLLIPKRHGQTDGRLTVASPRSALASCGKKENKVTNSDISRMRRDAPRSQISPIFGSWGSVQDVVMHTKFHGDRFRGFAPRGSWKSHFSYT